MARARSQEPTLTQGNIIYLYGLLAREIGCGKQTFLPRVEEALSTESMTAEDLGFESTRALLEALGDCVNLTVFKGGRIYATVIAQPTWDEALSAPADSKTDAAAKGGRPWKRKKSDKSLKPMRPRRVKREVIAPESETEPEPCPEIEMERTEQDEEAVAVTAEATGTAEPSEPAVSVEAHPEPEPEPVQIAAHSEAIESEIAPAEESEPTPEIASEQNVQPVNEEPQPSISLTITYDPYGESDEETTLEASRETLAETVSQPSAPVEPATVQTAENASPASPVAPIPSPEALASYPQDFAREVYCPAEHLAELNQLLPLGTAVMPLLAEDFRRAFDLELITGTRARATFPLRVQHLNAVEPIQVTIRKQSGPGLPWALSRVK